MIKLAFIALAIAAADPPRPQEPPPAAEDAPPWPRATAQRPDDPVRLRVAVRVPKRRYRPLEPIPLAVEVRNIGRGGAAYLDLDRNQYGTFKINVGDRRGEQVPKTLRSKWFQGAFIDTLGILPGKAYEPRLVANLVNDMTAPQEYRITVRVYFRSNANDGGARWAESEPVAVRVDGEPIVEGWE